MESGGVDPAPTSVAAGSDRLTPRDTLLLYALFAARCAKCRRVLVVESEASGKTYNLGKRAHVVGRSEDGPRGDGTVQKHERGDIRNHLLLCGTCHDEIDLDEDAWPIERLHAMRAEHIAWIESRLRDDPSDVAASVYSRLMQQACELVWLDAWAQWTEYMLDPFRSWRPQQVDAVAKFVRVVATTDWPGSVPSLETALQRLAFLLSNAAQSFEERAEARTNDLFVPRTYKRGFNPNFERDAAAFQVWLRSYESMIAEATMAAEWARSIWCAHGNPLFMLGERVHLVTSFNSDMTNRVHVFEYTAEQKARLLAAADPAVVPVAEVEYVAPADDLDRLLREILAEALGAEPAADVVEHLTERLRGAEGPFDSAKLFSGLPGRMPSVEETKRVTGDLHSHGVIERNPHGRGFVLGELP